MGPKKHSFRFSHLGLAVNNLYTGTVAGSNLFTLVLFSYFPVERMKNPVTAQASEVSLHYII